MLSRDPQGHLGCTDQDRHVKGTFISPLSTFSVSQSVSQGREGLFPVVTLGISRPAPKTGFLWSKGYHSCISPFVIAYMWGKLVESNGFCHGAPPPRQRRLSLPGLVPLTPVGRTVRGCQGKFSAPTCTFPFSLSLPPLF